jgi:Ca2+-binding RTX toxin-like protein
MSASITRLGGNLREAVAGGQGIDFLVTRTGDLSGSASLDWRVSGFGSAPVSADDLEPVAWPAGTITFVPGQESATLVIYVADDAIIEADEGLVVTLSNPVGLTIAMASAEAAILDDDTPPPAIPSLPDLLSESDLGISDSDNRTTAGLLRFGGTGEPGSFVTLFDSRPNQPSIYHPGGFLYVAASEPVLVGPDGRWVAELTMAPGEAQLRALATDAAGRRSGLSETLFVTALPAPTSDIAATDGDDLLTISGQVPAALVLDGRAGQDTLRAEAVELDPGQQVRNIETLEVVGAWGGISLSLDQLADFTTLRSATPGDSFTVTATKAGVYDLTRFTLDGLASFQGSPGDDTILGSAQGLAEGQVRNMGGGAGDDLVIGTERADSLYDFAGENTLRGGGGNDSMGLGTIGEMDGEEGDDSLVNLSTGAPLALVARGGAGDDRISIFGQGGSATIEGGAGRDWLNINGTGAITLNLDAGADDDEVLIASLAAGSVVDGGAGEDRLFLMGPLDPGVTLRNIEVLFAYGSVTLSAAQLASFSRIETSEGGFVSITASTAGLYDFSGLAAPRLSFVTGSAGDDTIRGANSATMLSGGAGNDRLEGRDAGGMLQGEDGADTLLGGSGQDNIYGGAGSDLLEGGDGDDFMVGSLGLETLPGDDTLLGRGGNDFLTDSDGGENILRGGEGNDILFASKGSSLLQGEEGDDRLQVAMDSLNGASTLEGGAGNDVLQTGMADDSADGGAGNDTINNFGGNDLIFGGEGDDLINGAAANDTLLGGAGRDVIFDFDGNNLIEGGDGDDSIVASSPAEGTDSTLRGGDGNDTIMAATSAALVDGGTGNDSIFAAGDLVLGGEGNDTLMVTQGRVEGGTGDDEISLASATSIVALGGDGDDRFSLNLQTPEGELHGGAGQDSLTLRAAWIEEGWGLGRFHFSLDPSIVVTGIETLRLETASVSLPTPAGSAEEWLADPERGYITVSADGMPLGISATQLADVTAIIGPTGTIVRLLGTTAGHYDLSGTMVDGGVSLTGSAGNDTLTGTGATDTLAGGAGRDRFAGTVAVLDGDRITDYEPGEVILVRGASFTAADVTLASGSSLISVDTDQDGDVDLNLTLDRDLAQIEAMGARLTVTQGAEGTSLSFVPGGSGITVITADTTWRAGVTYDLTDRTIQVAPGVTLTVEAGARVTGGAIEAYGALVVAGSAEARVELDRVALVTRGGTVALDHAHLRGGELLRGGFGAPGNLTLTNSVVEDLPEAIYVWYPTQDVLIENNLFLRSAGISAGTQRDVTVMIRDNSFVEWRGEAAVTNWASYNTSQTVVTGNNFLSTDRVALQLQRGNDPAAMQAEGNYFGSTDPAVIDAMVRDRTDSLTYAAVIDVTPVLEAPNPAAPAYTLDYVPTPRVETNDPLVILTDTVWAAGSTQDLTGKVVQVAPGVTLTVEAGARVTGGAIEAYGALVVAGSAEARVEFDGVALVTRGGTVALDHAHLRGGELLRGGFGAPGNLTLTNSVVEDLPEAIYVWYPTQDVLIENNLFLRSAGISAGTQGNVTVMIRDNSFVEWRGEAAVTNWASYNTSQTVVTGNNFLSTDRVALQLQRGNDPAAMQAEGNYFGSTDPAVIDAMVRDRTDSLAYAAVIDVTPVLEAPNPAAPAYTLDYVPTPRVETNDPLVILTDTVWAAGSTQDLTGKVVQVAPGVTLTVEAGARVTGGAIEAYGALVVAGSAEARVEFDGVALVTRGGTVALDHAHLRGGELLRGGFGAPGNLTLTNSVVEDLPEAIYVWYPTQDVLIENNLFLRSAGISAGTQGNVTVMIRDNSFVEWRGEAAVTNWASYNTSQTVVTGNNFLSTDRVALQLQRGNDPAAMQAEGNYFGSTDPAVIDAMVRDRTDSLAYAAVIDVTPVLEAPNPVAGPLFIADPAGGSVTATGLGAWMLGGAGADALTGTTGGDWISGGAGNDTLVGAGGDDRLDGGDGDDRLLTLSGESTLLGGSGADLLEVDGILPAGTVLDGGTGADTLLATDAELDPGVVIRDIETLRVAGSGVSLSNTQLAGFSRVEASGDGESFVALRLTTPGLYDLTSQTLSGITAIVGGNGGVTIRANRGDLALDRNFFLLDGLGDDLILGTEGRDLITSDRGRDTLRGGAGDDVLLKANGDDSVLDGGDGNDDISNSPWTGAATLLGGAGNDTIRSFGADASIEGGDGDDRISLAGGLDWTAAQGGDGNDTFVLLNFATAGSGLVEGGAGVDRVEVFGQLNATIRFTEVETLTILTGAPPSLSAEATLTLAQLTAFQRIESGAPGGIFTLTLAGGGAYDASGQTFVGLGTLQGSEDGDSIRGLANLEAPAGIISLFGRGGNDHLEGTRFRDNMTGNEGRDALMGLDGDDFLFGDEGDDTLRGGDGTDLVNGGAGADSLEGGTGDDWLYGGFGDEDGQDTLFGGDGADLLQGGRGADILTGGMGEDRFVGTAADLAGDRITDYEVGEQIIVTDVTFTAADVTLTQGSTIISVDIDQDGTADLTITLDLDLPLLQARGLLLDVVAEGDGTAIRFVQGPPLPGNDVLTVSGFVGPGAILDGGTGQDTLQAVDATFDPGATIRNIEVLEVTGDRVTLSAAQLAGFASIRRADPDRVFAIKASEAGDYDLREVGTDGRSFHLEGSDGADTLRAVVESPGMALLGGDGDDALIGGTGRDTLLGGLGDDRLEGGDGADMLFDIAGRNLLDGGDADDMLTGGVADSTLLGGAGQDTITLSAESGRIEAGSGNDSILAYSPTGQAITLQVEAGDGDDRIVMLNRVASGSSIDGGTGEDALVLGEAGLDPGVALLGIESIRVSGTSTRLSAEQFSSVARIEPDNLPGAYMLTATTGGRYDLSATPTPGLTSFNGSDEAEEVVAPERYLLIAGGGGDDTLRASDSGAYLHGGTLGQPAADDGDDLLIGGIASDFLDGGSGQNTLQGGAGGDNLLDRGTGSLLQGGDGTDVFLSQGSGARLDGGAGEDLMSVEGREAEIFGGAGDDTIALNASLSLGGVIDGGTGIDTLVLQPGAMIETTATLRDVEILSLGFGDGAAPRTAAVSLSGAQLASFSSIIALPAPQDGPDYIPFQADITATTAGTYDLSGLELAVRVKLTGTAQADTLVGSTGNETLLGGAGDDRLAGGRGSDLLDGGEGFDVAVFAGARATYSVTADEGGYLVSHTAPDGAGFVDRLFGIERLVFDDGEMELRPPGQVITAEPPPPGSNTGAELEGGAGADTITGNTGEDTLAGGDGEDALDGGAGNDTLEGGLGRDTLTGGAGTDSYVGTATELDGDRIEDYEAGEQIIVEGESFTADDVTLSRGSTIIQVDLDRDGAPDLTITLALDLPELQAMGLRLTVTAGADGSVISFVAPSNPGISETGSPWGNSLLEGGAGDDTLLGRGWNNTLMGGAGDDLLTAGAGQSRVDAGAGDDVILLDGWSNLVVAGDGDDVVSGSLGNSRADLGDGVALVDMAGWSNEVTIGDTPSGERSVVRAGQGNSVVTAGDGAVEVVLDGWNNRIEAGNGPLIISGVQGNSSVESAGGPTSIIMSGWGNHIVVGAGTSHVIDAGMGNARVEVAGGDATITARGWNNEIRTGDGDDIIAGLQGSSFVWAGDGDNRVTASGWWNRIETGSGADVIIAGDGGAQVSAGAGDDEIRLAGWHNRVEGGAGNDTIHSGAGGDTFVVNEAGAGVDTIFDFDAGLGDKLEFRGVSVGQIGVQAIGADLSVTVGGSEVALLTGKSDLTMDELLAKGSLLFV